MNLSAKVVDRQSHPYIFELFDGGDDIRRVARRETFPSTSSARLCGSRPVFRRVATISFGKVGCSSCFMERFTLT